MNTTTKHDWPEDFDHDNGMYYCRCRKCNEQFIGYKRRIVCKSCQWDFTTEQLECIRLQFIPEGKDASKETKDHNYNLRLLCMKLGQERYKMTNTSKLVIKGIK